MKFYSNSVSFYYFLLHSQLNKLEEKMTSDIYTILEILGQRHRTHSTETTVTCDVGVNTIPLDEASKNTLYTHQDTTDV